MGHDSPSQLSCADGATQTNAELRKLFGESPFDALPQDAPPAAHVYGTGANAEERLDLQAYDAGFAEAYYEDEDAPADQETTAACLGPLALAFCNPRRVWADVTVFPHSKIKELVEEILCWCAYETVRVDLALGKYVMALQTAVDDSTWVLAAMIAKHLRLGCLCCCAYAAAFICLGRVSAQTLSLIH